MTVAIGGALPSKEALEAAMKAAGTVEPTREEREADLLAAFADDPEQQEWVIIGRNEPFDDEGESS